MSDETKPEEKWRIKPTKAKKWRWLMMNEEGIKYLSGHYSCENKIPVPFNHTIIWRADWTEIEVEE